MRRTLAGLLAASALVLTACGGDSKATDDTAAQSSGEAEATSVETPEMIDRTGAAEAANQELEATTSAFYRIAPDQETAFVALVEDREYFRYGSDSDTWLSLGGQICGAVGLAEWDPSRVVAVLVEAGFETSDAASLVEVAREHSSGC